MLRYESGGTYYESFWKVNSRVSGSKDQGLCHADQADSVPFIVCTLISFSCNAGFKMVLPTSEAEFVDQSPSFRNFGHLMTVSGQTSLVKHPTAQSSGILVNICSSAKYPSILYGKLR